MSGNITRLVTVVAVLFIFVAPLTGCGVHARVVYEGGATEPEVGPVGGNTGAVSPGSTVPPPAHVPQGGDQIRDVPWNLGRFEPHQAFVYSITRSVNGTMTDGAYRMMFAAASDRDHLEVTYSVNCEGDEASDTVTVSMNEPLADVVAASSTVEACMQDLFSIPWDRYFKEPHAVGESWDITGPEGTLAFELIATEEHAGYPGLTGEWSLDGKVVARFTVHPDVPLPLYFRLGEGDNYVEYDLVEGGSGPTIH